MCLLGEEQAGAENGWGDVYGLVKDSPDGTWSRRRMITLSVGVNDSFVIVLVNLLDVVIKCVL